MTVLKQVVFMYFRRKLYFLFLLLLINKGTLVFLEDITPFLSIKCINPGHYDPHPKGIHCMLDCGRTEQQLKASLMFLKSEAFTRFKRHTCCSLCHQEITKSRCYHMDVELEIWSCGLSLSTVGGKKRKGMKTESRERTREVTHTKTSGWEIDKVEDEAWSEGTWCWEVLWFGTDERKLWCSKLMLSRWKISVRCGADFCVSVNYVLLQYQHKCLVHCE